MVLSGQPPMLDYITKLMLLELIKSTMERDLFAVIWIESTMSELHQRWRELDGPY